MVRYLFSLIFLSVILFSSLFFDYWNFILELVLNNHLELLNFVESKFVVSLILFTILYSISTILSLPIGSFLTFFGGYIFGTYYGFFPVIIGATLGIITLSKVMNWCLQKYPAESYFLILGLMIGSLMKLWPGLQVNLESALSLILASVGAWLAWYLSQLKK